MSKIEWTNETYNPIIGCSKISEGCSNCYAENMAFRLSTMEYTSYYKSVLNFPKGWNGKTHFVKSQLEKPFKWKKPRMIFVCSMGDLFHESVPFEWIYKVLQIIEKCPQHTFQILTKRPENIHKYCEWAVSYLGVKGLKYRFGENVWLGVTAENQEQANERIPILLGIPAVKRFVSCEPLLSDIELIDYEWYDYLTGYKTEMKCYGDTPTEQKVETNKIDWVIAGPETGTKARPMQKEWIENIYNQCKVANVPFFDKKDILGLNLKQFPNE